MTLRVELIPATYTRTDALVLGDAVRAQGRSGKGMPLCQNCGDARSEKSTFTEAGLLSGYGQDAEANYNDEGARVKQSQILRSLALHDIHEVPGILVKLQFQVVLFV